MNRHKRYPSEVRERAVRLVLEHQEKTITPKRRDTAGLIHHSDRDSQYLSVRYTVRLARPGSRPPWEVWAIPMTMPWRRQSSACTRRLICIQEVWGFWWKYVSEAAVVAQ